MMQAILCRRKRRMHVQMTFGILLGYAASLPAVTLAKSSHDRAYVTLAMSHFMGHDRLMPIRIRPAVPADLPALLSLIAEHAAYERAAAPPADLGERLAPALFGDPPRLNCLVAAEHDTAAGHGALAGYATWTRDFATWTGRAYTHLDCLYLVAGRRGQGLGARLLDAVRAATGEAETQWQTPAWNTDAQRFYLRTGAIAADKVRFTLAAAARPDSRPAST